VFFPCGSALSDDGRTSCLRSVAVEEPSDGWDEREAALVLGIRDYAAKCGFTRAHLGLSGGIDSALVAVLAVEALGSALSRALAGKRVLIVASSDLSHFHPDALLEALSADDAEACGGGPVAAAMIAA